MKDRIPSLNGLKTLESAGRLMSFARAAEELCVTPGAVSRQIRTLEDLLGFALFDRNHREVRLTPEAKEYVDRLGECFRQMERATYHLTKAHRHQALHIHCAFTFALRWLMPRLVGFHARHPHQEIRLATRHANNEELVSSDHVNLQIKTASAMAELAPALIGHRLMDIEIVPVCSPTLLGSKKQVGDISIFRRHTLLHSNVRRQDWKHWLKNAKIADADPESGIVFESSTLSYQAAIEGLGIAMGTRALVEGELKTGKLIIPHDFVLKTNTGLYFVHSASALNSKPVREFRDWIVAEAMH